MAGVVAAAGSDRHPSRPSSMPQPEANGTFRSRSSRRRSDGKADPEVHDDNDRASDNGEWRQRGDNPKEIEKATKVKGRTASGIYGAKNRPNLAAGAESVLQSANITTN